MDVLVIDVGGTRVKLSASGAAETRRFLSGATLTPESLVKKVKQHTEDWNYDVVSLGFPGEVDERGPTAEPGNLGTGWLGFDFADVTRCVASRAGRRPATHHGHRFGVLADEVHAARCVGHHSLRHRRSRPPPGVAAPSPRGEYLR
jgi:hypothetical protein